MAKKWDINKVRNIGISAHIDSGKTTLTERILFYTGRIHAIHEVRGKDGVGATMDSMELERERGITIQSAATNVTWKDIEINIIDTPGHVDFTVEVERALRVLDGAILVLCGVSGVQSQSITVDRQMRRYKVPRMAFINKLDRAGANPFRVLQALREKLRHNAALMQIPIGAEDKLEGVVDLVTMKAVYFRGDNGENLEITDIPADLQDDAKKYRSELIGKAADFDDALAEKYLMEEEPTQEELMAAIRKGTLSLDLTPVFMGSAYKNKGVQLLLDGVESYLPSPAEMKYEGLDLDNNEEPVALKADSEAPTVALAFKLEDGRFGQLTYMRVYQGTLKKGDFITNVTNGKKVKIPRLVHMHADSMQDIEQARAGDIAALFGIDCASGDTFTDGTKNIAMTSMFVPDPVISLAVAPKDKSQADNFSKALQKFRKEDPTFRVHRDEESNETIISGMGELHLEVYIERMKREFKVDVVSGQPQVAYRETITKATPFDYTHKKQTGGSGQFAKVMGEFEPLEVADKTYEFVNKIVGGKIPREYIPAVDKGFVEQMTKGLLIGAPIVGVKATLVDGAYHDVDSSEMAFRICAMTAFREAYHAASPAVLEPIMKLEVQAPEEFQGNVMGQINQRRGMINGTQTQEGFVVVEAQVPFSEMFGYSTELRSATQGKGEFTMEFSHYAQAPRNVQEELVKEYQKKRAEENK
ncbi:MAG: elongation factor G [Bdellovibrionaceae bacterium]|nr:elongation factor G [Pseudobdellovibrionaceae bacterium]|tara:strand:+ start:1569 stop:3671 length:2103 start_codon:yes stop_codon:yes gene_type:complete